MTSELPEAYEIGWVPFLDCHIDLSLRPLIPRPETEYWLELAIKEMPRDKELRVLDIFCGSGCIGVAVLKHLPNTHVTFSDIEPKFLEQTKINLEKNGIGKNRYTLVQSDMFAGIEGHFDYILANPPYIADSDQEVQDSVLDHEPHRALFAGTDGLKFLRPLIDQSSKYLMNNGKIYVEFGSDQKEVLESMYPHADFYKDQYNKWRCLGIST